MNSTDHAHTAGTPAPEWLHDMLTHPNTHASPPTRPPPSPSTCARYSRDPPSTPPPTTAPCAKSSPPTPSATDSPTSGGTARAPPSPHRTHPRAPSRSGPHTNRWIDVRKEPRSFDRGSFRTSIQLSRSHGAARAGDRFWSPALPAARHVRHAPGQAPASPPPPAAAPPARPPHPPPPAASARPGLHPARLADRLNRVGGFCFSA